MTRDNKLIMLSLFLWGAGESMWYFISTIYFDRLGATPEEIGLAQGFAALTIALAFLAGGLLADRFDRKWLLVGGWALGAIAPPLMALAGDWREFLIGYTVFNLSGYVVPVIDTYVAHSASRAPLERIFPLVYAGFWLGSVVGPQVSRALLGALDLNGVLIGSTGLLGLSTLAVAFVARQPPERTRRHRLRSGGQPTATPALAVQVPAAHVEARVSLIGALRPALWFFVLLFLIDFGMSIGAQFIPLYLEHIHWPVADISGVISAQMLGTASLSVWIGYISAGRRRRGLLISQLLVFAAMAAFAFGAPAWGGFAVAGYFLLGGFQSAKQQAVAQVAGYVEPQQRGIAFAMASTVGQMALAVAPRIAGSMYESDPALPFYASLALIPIGLLLTLRLRGPKITPVEEPIDASAGYAPADMIR